MTEYVADPHRECPCCGADYQRLGRHWTSGACAPPPIDDPTQELLTGLVIGNATAAGNGRHNHVVLPTQHRLFALWVHDELGWLSHGVRRVEPDGKRPQYRVRTHAHRALDRYREWYASGDKRIPEDVALTPSVARAWYACDGWLEWRREDSPPRIAFSAAIDGRREDIARLLRGAGYDPNVYDRRIRLSIPATERFLERIGDPVPGVEHRWMRDRAVARRLRRADASAAMERGEWYRELLALVAEALDAGREELTADRFDAAVASPSAAAIADWLGGGSFDDALHIAGVPPTTLSKNRGYQAGTEGGPRGETDTEGRVAVIAALRAAADDCGEPLTIRQYIDWAVENGAPSQATVFGNPDFRRFPSWTAACAAAGVEHGGGGGAPFHDDG